MSAETLQVTILTPEGKVCEEHTTMVLLPGEQGELGILPRHVALLTRLKAGIIQLGETPLTSQAYFVEGGFAEVSAHQCTILADKICSLDALTEESLHQYQHQTLPNVSPEQKEQLVDAVKEALKYKQTVRHH